LKMGFVAAASAVWLIIRTGRKPSRITYPCQKAAAANINLFLLAIFVPLLDFRKVKAALLSILNTRLTKTILLMSALLLAFGSITYTVNLSSPYVDYLPMPLNLKAQSAQTAINSSDLFFIQNASGAEGNMDAAVSTLLRLMENHGLHFYNTTTQPTGLIRKDDVVLIKVNSQWAQRGGTNTDLVRSVIKKIVNHPEGFTGEIVVADNGQQRGALNWTQSNAFNHSQSMQEVVNTFSPFRVSTWLWDTITTNGVNEYGQGDFNDGYVVNYTQNPIHTPTYRIQNSKPNMIHTSASRMESGATQREVTTLKNSK
jgi:hypothetical protein